MPKTSTQSITEHASAPPTTVYAALADLSNLREWLPRSSVYRGTTPARAGLAAVGDTYEDRTSLGELSGRVAEADPPHRIVFEQATANRALRIRITYELETRRGGTRIRRTGTITTSRALRLLHGPIVAFTRRENRRTLRQLALMASAS